MADKEGPSEEELLREESTPGPTHTGSMFAALLQEMRKINENILAITEPTEPSEKSTEREYNDSESLDKRVAKLTASGSTEPNVLLISLMISMLVTKLGRLFFCHGITRQLHKIFNEKISLAML